jgi:hypothetical protein
MQNNGTPFANKRGKSLTPNKEDTLVNKGLSREQIERVARMYKCNQDASRALGITIRSFSRLCRKYDIESPFARRRRQRGQAALSTNLE